MLKLKYLLLEICILYVVFIIIDSIFELIPYNYKFNIDSENVIQKLCFSFQFKILYTFVVLFGILILIKKILISKIEKPNNDCLPPP